MSSNRVVTPGPSALVLAFFLAGASTSAQEGAVRGVHDPCLIKADKAYYLFSTGPGIPVRTSRDLFHWERAGRVFATNPAWVAEAVPRSFSMWAPDISHDGKTYRLYYSVSTFGSNHSCIGLATNVTLDPARPDFRWEDQGIMIRSERGDDWNAIDPNFFLDREGAAWLAFGSFWSGIKLARLDATTGKPKSDRPPLVALAVQPDTKAIEAPFLFQKGEYTYLFASIDHCCRGIQSDYKVIVGRSRSVEGPYFDREGKPMTAGGGTVLIAGEGRVRGPGHNAVLHDGDRDWFVHHFYDADNQGAGTLQIRPLYWGAKDSFPTVGAPIEGPVAQ